MTNLSISKEQEKSQASLKRIGWAWLFLSGLLLFLGSESLIYLREVERPQYEIIGPVIQLVFGSIALIGTVGFFKRQGWAYHIIRLLSWLLLFGVLATGCGWLVVFLQHYPSNLMDAVIMLLGFLFVILFYASLACSLLRKVENKAIRSIFLGRKGAIEGGRS